MRKGVIRKTKARPRAVSRQTVARASRAPARKSESQVEALGLEALTVLRLGLEANGLSADRLRVLFDQALAMTSVPDTTGALLEQFQGLGDLIVAWLNEAPYMDVPGQGRPLAIAGSGATFETLARRYLPGVPLESAVEFACRYAKVGRPRKGLMAIYGDTLVKFASHPESALAQMISHLKRIVGTCLYNVRSAADDALTGRLERAVGYLLAAHEFEDFQTRVRPQLHELCEYIDRMLKSCEVEAASAPARKATAGIGLYVYYDDQALVTPRQPVKAAARAGRRR